MAAQIKLDESRIEVRRKETDMPFYPVGDDGNEALVAWLRKNKNADVWIYVYGGRFEKIEISEFLSRVA